MNTNPTLFDQTQTHSRRYNRDRVLGAAEWIAENPEPWAAMCRWGVEDGHARIRISFKRYAENMRPDSRVNVPVAHRRRIDNSIVAGLAREFVRLHPEYTHLVPMKLSRADSGAAA